MTESPRRAEGKPSAYLHTPALKICSDADSVLLALAPEMAEALRESLDSPPDPRAAESVLKKLKGSVFPQPEVIDPAPGETDRIDIQKEA